MEEYQVVSGHMLTVTVTSSVSSFASERRLQKDWSIGVLKGKLELLTGAASATMLLDVYNKEDQPVCKLDNNDALLGSYPIDDGMRIHVTDSAHQKGEYEDTSKVEKFEISPEEYAKRSDTVRAFKQRMKMGQFREVSAEEQQQIEEANRQKAEEERLKVESIKVGERCEVQIAKQPSRRGTVMYVGETSFKPGHWVGVRYDEPLGKNDGSVQGKRYFECPPKYGGFAKPLDVTTGDFPELGLEDEEMDEM